MTAQEFSFLGIKVNSFTKSSLIGHVEECVKKENYLIGYHNLHSLYVFHHDPSMRAFYSRANNVHIDGMPLVWLGNLFGYPLKRENRLTSLDWLEDLFALSEKHQWRIFLLGGKPGVADQAAAIFQDKFPLLQLQTHHGFFSMEGKENEELVEKINAYQPHLLLVGMGMPRQEKWLMDNLNQLHVNIAWSLGAFMDYYAGVVSTPPRWMGRMGLEWLYRLYSEPTRLWRRYLLEPFFVLKLSLLEYLKRNSKINR